MFSRASARFVDLAAHQNSSHQDVKEEASVPEEQGVRRERLQVLIERELKEEPEDDGAGWRVTVVEHLRLHVPANAKQIWIEAELQTWDPWLRQQKGFLGREVLWDSDSQEGVLLIHWSNHQDWLSIPVHEVNAIQHAFEALAKKLLALPPQSENPFPLRYSGEASTT